MCIDDAQFLSFLMDETIPLDEEFLIIIVYIAEILNPQFLQLFLNFSDFFLAILTILLQVYLLEDVGGVEVNFLFLYHSFLEFRENVVHYRFAPRLKLMPKLCGVVVHKSVCFGYCVYVALVRLVIFYQPNYKAVGNNILALSVLIPIF